jgi:serine/threonine-protein kinase
MQLSTDAGATRPMGHRVTSHVTSSFIGPYRVIRLLGSGGFGAVYLARDPAGREVAVKRLHAEHVDRPAAVARFEREIRVVGRIRHPSVVAILDVGDDAGPYFVMELLRGVDLREHLRTEGRMAPARALEILAPVADALAAAHDKGVVHRDLKASNVFLDEKRVVLLDFGIAKLLDDTGPALTASRVVLGSPSCVAPEQLLGHPVDERTDVYGLGVLAYHLFAGVLPFQHDEPTVVREMHLRQPPPPLTFRAPVPPELDRAVARALAKDPDARPGSVLELMGDLRRAVGRGERAAPAAGRHVAVHVEVASEELLDAIVAALRDAGMTVAFAAGNAALLLAPLGDPRPLVARVRALELGPRGAAYVKAGDPDALLRVGAWLPDEPASGVFIDPELET